MYCVIAMTPKHCGYCKLESVSCAVFLSSPLSGTLGKCACYSKAHCDYLGLNFPEGLRLLWDAYEPVNPVVARTAAHVRTGLAVEGVVFGALRHGWVGDSKGPKGSHVQLQGSSFV